MLNFDWLSDIDVSVAKILLISVFVIQFLLALILKRKYIFAGAPDQKPWRNLKIWIFFLSVIMISLYLYF